MSSAVGWSPVIKKASFFKAKAWAWKSSEIRWLASWPVGSVSVGSCTPLKMLSWPEGCPGSPAIMPAPGGWLAERKLEQQTPAGQQGQQHEQGSEAADVLPGRQPGFYAPPAMEDAVRLVRLGATLVQHVGDPHR